MAASLYPEVDGPVDPSSLCRVPRKRGPMALMTRVHPPAQPQVVTHLLDRSDADSSCSLVRMKPQSLQPAHCLRETSTKRKTEQSGLPVGERGNQGGGWGQRQPDVYPPPPQHLHHPAQPPSGGGTGDGDVVRDSQVHDPSNISTAQCSRSPWHHANISLPIIGDHSQPAVHKFILVSMPTPIGITL